jgi:hypothetical protein
MNQALIELALKRGRLIERIAGQRAVLARQLQPVQTALRLTNRTLLGICCGIRYVKRHPGTVVAASLMFIMLKPQHLWRWTRRSFIAWRAWRAWREQLVRFGWRARR